MVRIREVEGETTAEEGREGEGTVKGIEVDEEGSGAGTTIVGDTILNRNNRGISTARISRPDQKDLCSKTTEDQDRGTTHDEVTGMATAAEITKALSPPPRTHHHHFLALRLLHHHRQTRQCLPLPHLHRCLLRLRRPAYLRHRHRRPLSDSRSLRWPKRKRRRCKSAPWLLLSIPRSTLSDISVRKRLINERSAHTLLSRNTRC